MVCVDLLVVQVRLIRCSIRLVPVGEQRSPIRFFLGVGGSVGEANGFGGVGGTVAGALEEG